MFYRENQCHGIALIIVLWIVSFLAVIAATFAFTMSTEVQSATFAKNRAEGVALAEGGINYALWKLQGNRGKTMRWPEDGSEKIWRFADRDVHISVTRVGGLVDLNLASRKLLGALLTGAGVGDEDRDRLLDRIEDWRDRDDLKRLNGAEKDSYEQEGKSAGPKNHNFESINELRSVLGMSEPLYRKLVPYLTVYSRQRGIDPRYAPKSLLRMLANSPEVNSQGLQDYLQQRKDKQALGERSPNPPRGMIPFVSRGRKMIYHIRARVRISTSADVTVGKVAISRSRNKRQPVQVLANDVY